METMDAVILAGGLGTRLRTVVDGTPKCLASVNDLPFLTYKLYQLRQAGVRRVILCLGYLAEQIRDYFEAVSIPGLQIDYVFEKELLGTAGAIKNAEPHIRSEHFLVLNGDVYLDLDYRQFTRHHVQADAQASLAVAQVADPSRYGLVLFNEDRRIKAFLEKQAQQMVFPGKAGFHINAGTYCFHRAVLDRIPHGTACSLEREIFPKLIADAFYAYPVNAYFIDIGTPESYTQVQQDIKSGRLKVAS